MVFHSSEIRNFRVDKQRLKPNEVTYATGELWHCFFHLPWICGPKSGEVRLMIDGTEYDKTQTGAGGIFYLTLVAPMTSGTYFVYARHPGIMAVQTGCDSERVSISVEEIPPPPPPPPNAKPDWFKIGVIVVGVTGVMVLIAATNSLPTAWSPYS